MDEHLHNIDVFHGTLKTFTDWLNNTEITMRGFKYPSKIVYRVIKQMEDHNVSTFAILVRIQRGGGTGGPDLPPPWKITKI